MVATRPVCLAVFHSFHHTKDSSPVPFYATVPEIEIKALNSKSAEGLCLPESLAVWRAHLSQRESHIHY